MSDEPGVRELTREQAYERGMKWGELREVKPEVLRDDLLLYSVRAEMDRSAGPLFVFDEERLELRESDSRKLLRGRARQIGLVIRLYRPKATR